MTNIVPFPMFEVSDVILCTSNLVYLDRVDMPAYQFQKGVYYRIETESMLNIIKLFSNHFKIYRKGVPANA